MTITYAQAAADDYTMPKLVGIIYDRISRDKGYDAENVENQYQDSLRTAQQLGCTSTLHFRDNDITAADPTVERPDFQRLMTEIALGLHDGAVIIVPKQDRFVRQGTEYEEAMVTLAMHHMRFHARGDGIDIRPAVDSVFTSRIRNAVSAEEIRTLKWRVNNKLAANRSRGKRHGKVPFGWKADGTPEPVEAAMVLDATDRALAGESLRAIAREWNAADKPRQRFTRRKVDGVKLPAEEQFEVVSDWTGNAIMQLLTRDCNAGRLTHKGQLMDVEALWEPIVPADRFLAVTAFLAARDRPAPARRHLLGGLIRCRACGGNVCGVINKAGKYTYVFYRCLDCQQTVYLDQVDRFVESQVIDRLEKLKLPDLATADRRAAMREMADQLSAIIGQIADTDDRFSNYSRPRDERIDATSHARIMTNLRTGKEHTEKEIDRLSRGCSTVLRGLTGANTRLAYEALGMDQRRAVITTLCRLHLLPGSRRLDVCERIVIEWNELG